MTVLEIGDIIQDNDPRMLNRKLIVDNFQFDKKYVFCRPITNSSRLIKIRADRVYTDDKVRTRGFRKVV